MDMKNLTDRTIIGFYQQIRRCLYEDDQMVVANREPEWCVRDTQDWKQMAQSLGAEMDRREVQFAPIKWYFSWLTSPQNPGDLKRQLLDATGADAARSKPSRCSKLCSKLTC
jgi:hypothetical protein